jgi:subtilase family serine protease
MRLSVGSVIVAVGSVIGIVAGGLAASPPAGAAQGAVRPVALASSEAPRIPAGARRVGPVPASQRIRLDVSLKVRDQAGLNALLAGLANRKSPYYHHFLARGQFGPRFGPTLAQVASVDAALKAAGLAPGPVTADRLSIPVTATAAQIQHAFGTSMVDYRLPGGRVAFANTTAPKIDPSVAPLLNGITGLSNLYQPRPAGLHRASPAGSTGRARPAAGAAAGPHPCAKAVKSWRFTMDVWARHYGMNSLYGLGDLGQGQRVALLELEPNLPSDVTAFESCYGISTQVNYVPIDGGAGTGPGRAEAALDIDVLAGMAPAATIDVYQAPNTFDDLDDIVRQFTVGDTETTLSVSWGLCELNYPMANIVTEAGLAGEAAAQGQTILVSTGDTGSTDCGDTNVSPDVPAMSPYVTAVGGTEITHGSEEVWNDKIGSGGGGISSLWCMANYQYQAAIPGLFDKVTSTEVPGCVFDANLQGFLRPLPDVSALASTSYGIFYNGRWLGGIGGTSAATPLWAAISALTNASPYCGTYASGNPGVLPMALYGMAAANQSAIYGAANPEALRDITVGNNDFTPTGYTGGDFPATPGYDLASGLGAPMVSGVAANGKPSSYIPGYAALMCRTMATQNTSYAVTGVSPGSGTGGQVTISGNGFLPIPGAERVQVTGDSGRLATLVPSCTATACTVTLPAEPAGTVSLQLSVESGAYTPAADAQYTYNKPATPHITSISPAKGTHNGGTKVTIKGRNFVGVRSVTFGGKAGTHLAVSGTGKITVTAPKGTKGKTVKVIIKAAGGTSNSVVYLYT